jgi:hypothetical protein
MVLQGGANLRRSEIVAYVQGVVDVAVQLTRNDEGKRIVSDIGFTPRGAGAIAADRCLRASSRELKPDGVAR